MIQVYDPGNTDYTKNGNMTLMPSEASVHAILGGMWEAMISHPIDTLGRWRHLVEEAVVKMPSFNGAQLFRIRKAEKSDSGVYCVMDPIFYDCRDDAFLTDVRPENKNGQQALDILCTGKYSGESDILTSRTAYYVYKNLLEALVGDEDNSFVNRWGGEPIYDNYNVIINARAGSDYNVEIRYGKNLPENGMTVELDMSEMATRIYPKAYNGYEMSNHGYVDSPLRSSYAKTYARTITYDDVKMREDEADGDAEAGVTICDTQAELDAALQAKCNADYDEGIDKPLVTIEADLILLQNMEQYADIAKLETVSLGDTIHCYNNHLGFTTNARVMELTYNSIKKRVEAVTLGAYRQTYFDKLRKGIAGIDELAARANSVLNGDGSIMAERVKGFLNGAMTSLRAQYNIAEHMNYVAVLFENLDPTSDLYGALAIGTQGLMISKQRNAAGTDWVWTTAATAAGIVADTVVTGAISDATGSNSWDLDNGPLIIAKGYIDLGSGAFVVTNAGAMTCTNADVKGKVTSQDGNEKMVLDFSRLMGYHITSDTPRLKGYLDLSADTGSGNNVTYEAVIGSNHDMYFEIGPGGTFVFYQTNNGYGTARTACVEIDGGYGGNVRAGRFTGDLVGNVTGDLAGDVTGNVTGNLTGNVTGNVTGDVTGNVTGNLAGNVTGNVTGNLTGDVQGDVHVTNGENEATIWIATQLDANLRGTNYFKATLVDGVIKIAPPEQQGE